VHPENAQPAELGGQRPRQRTALEPIAGVGDNAVADERADGVADVALFVGQQRVDCEEVGGLDARCGDVLADDGSLIFEFRKSRLLDHMPAALRNLRVLDLSRVLAGPFATMLLGDLGAEVTKVERPPSGDDTRAWGPPFDSAGRATYFEAVNRNKSSLALDLSSPAGLDRALALAREADVIVENFRPGVATRLGLGYDELREARPQLVYCSITGFGTGAGAGLPGYDLLVQALGGLMSVTGEPGGEPQKVGVALVDVIAGLFATIGILAALRHRDLTGEGQHVEVNLLSSLLAALVNQASGYTVAGVVPQRLGNTHPSIAPCDVFTAADGHLVLALGNDRQFVTLCGMLGDSGLAAEARFSTNASRVEHRDELRIALERLLAARPAAEWTADLMAAGVPAGEINDIGAAFELAARLGLEPVVEIQREDESPARLTRNPISLSATPVEYRLPPPALPGMR
jgi:crotonobetainyl-CoA:carnitine CoA-transferase CaiB-like acyl-CoA transferase